MPPDSLFTALLAVQGEAPTLPKDKTNPHFRSKFTGLETIVEKLGPVLQKHGLVWTTLPGRDEQGNPALDYRLIHASTGDSLDGTMPLWLTKDDSQGFGSAITYARRYALCAVLNLVADEDDDGNAASTPTAAQQSYGNSQGSSRPSYGFASEPQQKEIKRLATVKKASTDQLLEMAKVVGADVKKIEPGWTAKLTGGKQGQASEMISWLKERPLPDLAHPTDVPTAEEDFAQPDVPSLEDELAQHGVPEGLTEETS